MRKLLLMQCESQTQNIHKVTSVNVIMFMQVSELLTDKATMVNWDFDGKSHGEGVCYGNCSSSSFQFSSFFSFSDNGELDLTVSINGVKWNEKAKTAVQNSYYQLPQQSVCIMIDGRTTYEVYTI